ncbi:MAG: site-2 protease family protein, partial [Candidatus Aenigmarchaeota archaeon]|nr:site-2 protease family protein [Candidatus Aenigmarchaeota archaeon]
MAVRRQKRLRKESYVSEAEKELLKFLAFCLTCSVFFHELGHFITAILIGYEVKGFCLLGFCTVDNPEEFYGYESLATGVLVEVSFSKSDAWK